MADGSPNIHDVPADWEALEDAFENNAPEVHSYLHIKTGEVLRVVDGIADPEMHSRIATDSNYMRIDPVSSREQYRWMERFIPMVTDPIVQERLTTAIDGKGAFRRFKDVLMSFTAERERWFAFRSERLRVFMEAWLGAHGLQPIARPPVEDEVSDQQIAEAAESAPALSPEQLAARRNKGSEILRKQLSEFAEVMAGRDLEKVVAFAEFLKARRAARSFSQRGDSAPPQVSPAATEPQEREEAPEIPPTRH